jgi:hypothetical protein
LFSTQITQERKRELANITQLSQKKKKKKKQQFPNRRFSTNSRTAGEKKKPTQAFLGKPTQKD